MIISEILQATKGTVVHKYDGQAIIKELVTDSRHAIKDATSALFVAISGDRHDGHLYVNELYERGVRNFIIEQQINLEQLKYSNVILVKSSVKALQAIATRHRLLFSFPIIGITGSNGKTILKEWLFQLLSTQAKVVKSPKSYNSQIGVPLSVWQMSEEYDFGIFEAGISKVGEMSNLEKVIKPTLGIFSNIGPAHDEGFDDIYIKIKEKIKLFDHANQLIYCKDHSLIDEVVSKTKLPVFTWSLHGQGQVNATIESGYLSISYAKVSFQLKLKYTDAASIENLMHCVATMLYLQYSPKQIQQSVKLLPFVKMRLELKKGVNGCQLIDDTYNNDLAGIEVALQFLSQQSSLSKTVILSDILQSGLPTEELYQQVANLLTRHKVRKFIGVGHQIINIKSILDIPAYFFPDTKELLEHIDKLHFEKEAILIKGARIFAFEQVTAVLTEKIHGTVLEINLNALTHNLNFYKSQLQTTTKLMVMVKALAYGSGSEEVAHLLAHHQVDYLGVAYIDEGVALRKAGITTPIMVMNPAQNGFDSMITHRLEPVIYNLHILQQLIEQKDDNTLGIHIKIDTGMKRLGFDYEDVITLVILLKKHPSLEVKSIFTHLAGADRAIHNDFSKEQVTRFLNIYDQIASATCTKPLKHVVNSSGIIRFREYQFDMVRLGIGIYGIDSTTTYQSQLQPISTLKTIISQIKEVQDGETIGYGRNGKTKGKMKIATIAIGYADGYSRALGNGVGEVMINDHIVSVIGDVCMDMAMVDITGLDAKIGDEVVVFGAELPIERLADKLNTIPYEILTNINTRVKRVYFLD